MNKTSHTRDSCLSALLLSMTLAWAATEIIDPTAGIDQAYLNKIEKKYGAKPKMRLIAWKEFIADNKHKSTEEKLISVNNFFNQKILYGADKYVWLKKDYWATPTEFLIKGAGDCEDYSIAKYFTLRALGIPDKNLQITYVKVHTYRQGANRDLAHMVLSYFPEPNSTPLILDNLNNNIVSADKRNDLEPVYSFNAGKLWVAKQYERGRYSQDPNKIKRWANLNRRML